MKILTLDTSGQQCSVALSHGEQIFTKENLGSNEHSRCLLPMIQSLLEEAQLSLSELDALAFTQGPGSFTGLRIGVSVIQALAFAQQLPVIPISTLQGLAQKAYQEQGLSAVMAVMDARMGEVYWNNFLLQENGIMESQTDDKLSTPEAINCQSDYAVGSGLENSTILNHPTLATLKGRFPGLQPSASSLLAIAQSKFVNNLTIPAEKITAIYLRNKVC